MEEEPKYGYIKNKEEFMGVLFTKKDGSTEFVQDINYLHVVPDSQYVDDLNMIKVQVENIKYRLLYPNASNYEIDGTTWCFISSLEEEINNLLVSINNTIKQGYKLTKEDK